MRGLSASWALAATCVVALSATAGADEPADLRKQKLTAAKNWQLAVWSRYETDSRWRHQETYAVSLAVMEAERDVATTKAARIAAVQGHLDRITQTYRVIHILFVEQASGGWSHDLYRGECWLLEARQWLREEQARTFP